MKKVISKIKDFQVRQPAIFFVAAVILLYLLYKFIMGFVQKEKVQKITAEVNASNAAVQASNSATSVNSVRAELMQGICQSIKQQAENYGFFEKYISFDPTPYIQDVNRMLGANEAIYASQWYNQQYTRSLKADLQMIAYSENSFLGEWTAKGGRYSDIKEEVRNALY
ncbi:MULTISPECIES: hypothetical protein [Chitinophagaceae]